MKFDKTLESWVHKNAWCKCGGAMTTRVKAEKNTVLSATNICQKCGKSFTGHCSERTLQQICVNWFHKEFPNSMIHANKLNVYGDGDKANRAASQMITDGSIKHFPDLMLIFINHIAFVEMKKGGTKLQLKDSKMLVSDERINGQYLRLKQLNQLGHRSIFCSDFEKFKEFAHHEKNGFSLDWIQFSGLRQSVKLWEPKNPGKRKVNKANKAACELFRIGRTSMEANND